MKIEGYDILPCPFCGKLRLLLHYADKENKYYWMFCKNCQAEGPVDLGVSGAIDAWNTRYEADNDEEPPYPEILNGIDNYGSID